MSKMYCEKCQSDVLTKREDLDIGIIIILCIFTAGLGVLIYFVVYYDKNPNRCIHCNSICKPNLVENHKAEKIALLEEKNGKMQNYSLINEIKEESKFCYNCGTELDDRERKFCPFCGVNVE